MTHDLGADLDQLFAQSGQRSVLNVFRQRQRPHEIAEAISERMELKPDGIVAEAMAGEPRPVYGVLAFLDVLLRRAPASAELRHPLSRPR